MEKNSKSNIIKITTFLVIILSIIQFQISNLNKEINDIYDQYIVEVFDLINNNTVISSFTSNLNLHEIRGIRFDCFYCMNNFKECIDDNCKIIVNKIENVEKDMNCLVEKTEIDLKRIKEKETKLNNISLKNKKLIKHLTILFWVITIIILLINKHELDEV